MNAVKGALTREIIKGFQKKFYAEPKNILATNACAKSDPLDIGTQRPVAHNLSHVYNHKINPEMKPMTNQKVPGRCWIFAPLNAMRIPFAKHHLIEEFEFSQSYIFFWDKVERCNYILHSIVEVAKRGEEVDGRLVSFLLSNSLLVADGGQWDMFRNVIVTHGIVPKKCYPETFCSEKSSRMNNILRSKLKEYARDIYQMHKKGATDDQFQESITNMMEKLYRIIVICLGIPPETITWEYYDKNKVYCKVGPITPLQFYEEHVKPHYDVDEKVVLINDPRTENPYNKTYTVEFLNNIIGARKVCFINQEIEKLLAYTTSAIKNNEAVFSACDTTKRFSNKLGFLDFDIYDYNLLFGVDLDKSLAKAERLLYKDSCMVHTMIFTGVTVNEDNEPIKLRVENSRGPEWGDKGYLLMTAEWFKEFCFEVVIDKMYLPPEVLELQKLEPKVLPVWDPIGSVA